MISSDSFVPYPKRIGSQVGNGQVQVAGGPVAGILAGGPPVGSSPASNPSLPIAVTDTLVNYTPNPSTSPPQPVSPPVGAIDSLKYIQVINTGPGFVLVIQGSFLGITPPFAACRYTLSGVPGLPVNLTGWDGGYPAAVGKNAPVFILWSSNQFSNDLSWEGPSSSGGGGFVGVPFAIYSDFSSGGFTYDGVTGGVGKVEQWHVTAFSSVLVGGAPVTNGKVGTLLYAGAMAFNQPLLPSGSFVNIQLVDPQQAAPLLGPNQAASVPNAMMIPTCTYSFNLSAPGLLSATLPSIQMNVIISQPDGSPSLGPTGIDILSASLTVTQTQLQS